MHGKLQLTLSLKIAEPLLLWLLDICNNDAGEHEPLLKDALLEGAQSAPQSPLASPVAIITF
jgi:hypothetical protein